MRNRARQSTRVHPRIQARTPHRRHHPKRMNPRRPHLTAEVDVQPSASVEMTNRAESLPGSNALHVAGRQALIKRTALSAAPCRRRAGEHRTRSPRDSHRGQLRVYAETQRALLVADGRATVAKPTLICRARPGRKRVAPGSSPTSRGGRTTTNRHDPRNRTPAAVAPSALGS